MIMLRLFQFSRTFLQFLLNFQPKVSVEDIALRMPLPPGSIPPWEIEKPLMDGDVTEAITTWRRISQNSHPLLLLASLMKKKDLIVIENFHCA